VNPPYFGPPIGAIEVRVDRCLAGSKVAFQFGNGPIYVSPAMWELMKNANERELRVLLETIRIRKLPPLPDYTHACPPMFTAGGPSAYNYSAAKLDLQAFTGPGGIAGGETS
jgi:hypothetical protein